MQTLFSLYVGRSRENGPEVSEAELSAFFERIVAPRFSGFSVADTVGYWHGQRERSIRLDVIAAETERQTFAYVSGAAKGAFGQSAVMWTETPVRVMLATDAAIVEL